MVTSWVCLTRGHKEARLTVAKVVSIYIYVYIYIWCVYIYMSVYFGNAVMTNDHWIHFLCISDVYKKRNKALNHKTGYNS